LSIPNHLKKKATKNCLRQAFMAILHRWINKIEKSQGFSDPSFVHNLNYPISNVNKNLSHPISSSDFFYYRFHVLAILVITYYMG